MTEAPIFLESFQHYFSSPIAQRAAKPLSGSAEIEFRIIGGETFHFTKGLGENAVLAGPAADPQVVFILTPQAAEAVLAETSDQIGTVGVGILKLIASTDPEKKISVRLKSGFLALFNKGYLGVLTIGGSEIASFLASKGLSGMGAIKDALRSLRS